MLLSHWKWLKTTLNELGFSPLNIQELEPLPQEEPAESLGTIDLGEPVSSPPESQVVQPSNETHSPAVSEQVDSLIGNDTDDPSPTAQAPTGPERVATGSSARSDSTTETGLRADRSHGAGSRTGGSAGGGGKGTGGGSGRRSVAGRKFISYVGAHPTDDEPDLDGLKQEARMALEEKAIVRILEKEPILERTLPGNEGFDLFEPGEGEQHLRWIEVKAMSGSLDNQDATLSSKQFEYAQKHREAYWLYVVEHADDDEIARIVRIQDPAGKARTFTFDRGWLTVAKVDSEKEDQGG